MTNVNVLEQKQENKEVAKSYYAKYAGSGKVSTDSRDFLISADFANANKKYYDKYGDLVAPINYLNRQTMTLHPIGVNGLFRFEPRDISTEEAFKKPLTPQTSYLPMEVLDSNIYQALDNWNKFGNNGEFGDLKIIREDYAHNGFTKFWTILSDRKQDVKVGDLVQFGINVRNGIGTEVALGADLFSYRLSCQNGAVARSREFGSVRIYHKGNEEDIEGKFTDGFSQILEKAGTLLEYYKTMTDIKMSEKLLDYILEQSQIPLRYLPEKIVEVSIPTNKERELGEEVVVKLRDKNASLYEFFQGITNPLSRAIRLGDIKPPVGFRPIGFKGFTEHTTKLHQVVINAIKNPRSYA